MDVLKGLSCKFWAGTLTFILFSSIIQATVVNLPVPCGISIVHASESVKNERPKIGLVLSGGGARGVAHLGVIKVLEKKRIPIDYIVGTSMGAIVAGLYASGMTPDQTKDVIIQMDWYKAFQDDIPRQDKSFRRKTDDKNYMIKYKPGFSGDLELKLPSGFVQGQTIDLILKELVLPVSQIQDFDKLKIPYRAVATDIDTGKPVILDSGDLATAMRASMSVPAIFSTVEINGKHLVDGGVSNNLPIDVARKMGADIVIAVDISTQLKRIQEAPSSLRVTQQLMGILTRRNTDEQIATLSETDILIVPELGNLSFSSFDQAGQVIPTGSKAAEQKSRELSALSMSESGYRDYLSSRPHFLSEPQASAPVIDFVRLNNQSKIDDKVFLSSLGEMEGHPLDTEKLNTNLGNIYGLELFENVSYEIIEENGRTGLSIDLKERSWGPNYLQAGISLAGNQDGESFYDLSLAYTRTAVNSLNGEWRSAIQVGSSPGIFTELYQPIDFGSRYFINPRLLYYRENLYLYSSDAKEKLAEYRLAQYGLDLSLGRQLGNWGEFRIGYMRMAGDTELKVGKPIWPNYDFDRGEIYTTLTADTLDNLYFPTKGYSGLLKFLKSDQDIGADVEFEQAGMEANLAMSWDDRNTLFVGTKIYATIEGNAPLQNKFQLGGLFNLSGFNEDQLSGDQLGLLRLIYSRRINNSHFLPAYLGFSLETGNVWEDKDDMSLDNTIFSASAFLGLDTLLGPIYIGYGQAESGNYAVYFYLGKFL